MNLLIITFISLLIIFILFLLFLCTKDSYNNISKNQTELKDIPIFIINLKHRTDRKKNMINLLEKLTLKNYKFVIPLSKQDSNKQIKQLNFHNISVEQYSLLKTVMDIHLDMFKKNIKEYIIAEDDLELNYNDIDYNYINNKYKKIRNDYDLFFLNFCYSTKEKKDDNLYKIFRCLCAGFTIFNNSNYKLSNQFNKFLIYKLPLDHFYKTIMNYNKLKVYGSKIFKQNTQKFGTDITGSQNFNKPW
jgi:hypothetical protein